MHSCAVVKPFLLFSMSLDRCDSTWALGLLTLSLAAQTMSLGPSSFQGFIPWYSTKQSLEEVKVSKSALLKSKHPQAEFRILQLVTDIESKNPSLSPLNIFPKKMYPSIPTLQSSHYVSVRPIRSEACRHMYSCLFPILCLFAYKYLKGAPQQGHLT